MARDSQYSKREMERRRREHEKYEARERVDHRNNCKELGGKLEMGLDVYGKRRKMCVLKLKKDESVVEFVAAGRYGYYCVDLEFSDRLRRSASGVTLETIICGIKKKDAEVIADALQSATDGRYNDRADKFLLGKGYDIKVRTRRGRRY